MAIEIENKDLFGKVIADALSNIERANLQTWEKLRWVNAVSKAAAQIEDFWAFMTWQENDTLLIWSDRSNAIYEANGVCQCKAFDMGQPCWHRSAKQLIKNYFAALKEAAQAPAKEVPMEKSPYFSKNIQVSAGAPVTVGNIRI